MALPPLPSQGQNPWYVPRTAWDTAVKSDLEGRLSAAGVKSTIATQTFVVDDDYATLEDAFAAVSSGGVLEIRRSHSRATAFAITKPCTVRFTQTGSITATTNTMAAITVSASDVILERPRLIGPGGNISSTGDGIRIQATAGAPVLRLQILGPRIEEFPKHAILAEHIQDFRITGLGINRCGYAGVMLLSAVNGSVYGGKVKDILQPAGFVNSYGVAVSRTSTGSILTTYPRSRDVTVEEVTVDGVLLWEAFDTHAGENIVFRNNTVYNSRTGIAIIGSKDETNLGTVYAPINCTVEGNTLSSGVLNGTAAVGIVFAGAADTLGAPTELATGFISKNIMRDFGAQASSTGTSIQLYGTVGVSVSQNIIINSGFSGIDFYHDNYACEAMGNVIVDVWSDSASSCYAVQLRASYNEVSIGGTKIYRGGKTAVKVNDRGLNIGAFATNLVNDTNGNQWYKATTLATAGDVTTTEMRNSAKKVGFYGVTPVARAAAIASPAADVASLKTAVDAIRGAVSGVGITS